MNVANLSTARYNRQERNVAAEVAALQASNPHLVPAGDSLTAAAKNIRIELKRAFKGVKFSVRTERFSMGDAIRVHWVDGPTEQAVTSIVKRYESGTFDSMTDCAGYNCTTWMRAFGEARFVTTSRKFSATLMAAVGEHVAGIYGVGAPEIKVYSDGSAYFNQAAPAPLDCCRLGHLGRCWNIAECTSRVLNKISRAR